MHDLADACATWAFKVGVRVRVDVEFTGNACCCCCEVVAIPDGDQEGTSGEARTGAIAIK